jgi:hypothetical protein
MITIMTWSMYMEFRCLKRLDIYFPYMVYCKGSIIVVLYLCPVYFDHCVVCPSIYCFWLPLWYLQAWQLCCLSFFGFLLLITPLVSSSLTIVLSVLLRFTASDYPFGVFKLFVTDNTIVKLEDTKGVIRSSKSKGRQHNGQNKQDTGTKQRSTKHYIEN